MVKTRKNSYGPKYNSKKWNKNRYIRKSHNCYAYFLNKIDKYTKNKCKKKSRKQKCEWTQPGYYSGWSKLNKNTHRKCKTMNKRVLSDNKHIFTTTMKKKCPNNYYMGALAVYPNKDYHFYRQDHDNYWSHKNADKKATRYDASGKLIKDPKRANRKYKKYNYKHFCNYYCVPVQSRKKHFRLRPKKKTRKKRNTKKKS